MNTSIECFIAGLLGILFHVFALKLPAVKKRAEAANVAFSVKEYLKADWLALISSVLTLIICVYVLDEITKFRPSILDWIKFFFVFIGFTGSSILIHALGRADKTIRDIVDVKTNIADGK